MQSGPEKPAAPPAPPVPDDDLLVMVPLAGKSDGTYDDGKRPGSSTEFFAIPHANRQGSNEPAPPARPPPAAPPIGAPPMVQGPVPVGGPMVGGPQPVMGIQGPMAVGQGPGMGMGMPYGMAPPNPDEGRTQSYRVFGVVIGLVLMVCVALVVTVALVVVAVYNANQPEPLPDVVYEAPKAPITSAAVDTGGAVADIPVAPRPVARPKTPRPTTPRPKPAAPPPEEDANGGSAAGVAGPLTINVPGDVHVTAFEISCPSGFRQRAMFANSTATQPDAPAEDCAITFKGGTISTKFTSVSKRPVTYTCTKRDSSSLTCR